MPTTRVSVQYYICVCVWLIYKHLIHHQAEPEPLSNVQFTILE